MVGYNPYVSVRDFWGEELSGDLVARMVKAPDSHYRAFVRHDMEKRPDGFSSLPELRPGQSRPILTRSASDHLASRSTSTEATLLLLYADELVMQFPGFGDEDRDDRHRTLDWLLQVRPLFDMQVIHFQPVSSAKVHPAYSHAANEVEKVAQVLARDPESSVATFWHRWKAVADEAGVSMPETWADEYDPILWVLARDAATHRHHEARYGRNAHRLFRSQAELDLWRAWGGPPATVNERVAARLVSLELPRFERSIPDLVSVRKSSEAFAEWRSALGRAIEISAPDDEVDTSRADQLKRDLGEQLAPFAQRVETEAKNSPSLASLRLGVKEFGLGAVASGAGYFAGGSLGTAIATGGMASALKAGVDFVGRRQNEARDKRLSKLAMLFFDE